MRGRPDPLVEFVDATSCEGKGGEDALRPPAVCCVVDASRLIGNAVGPKAPKSWARVTAVIGASTPRKGGRYDRDKSTR
ncbi:MAG: hypothetical protein JWR24_2647 [Actinoallomurus sp.]|nr:hypothetical protein [Actinoallomurus sp.]